MAKVYGGRWQIINGPRLGGGGQAEVFRVRDVTGQLEGEYALKRVLNFARHERFLREIEAIKRLTDPVTHEAHPNVISLIDHSALNGSEDAATQFLVMPIAEGGDLSERGRISLYKDSIDSVVQVAKQIAAALHAAHAAEIIHRDVKPMNILFTGNGHELWLSDFGICLIREAPRLTDLPEVVGPRWFMAPELEAGGNLEVTPAADIYSLGKVMYYMITGGVILPRERLDEAQFRKVFAKGERYHLLELLLDRMICSLGRRLQTIDAFRKELEKLETWEQNARVLPVSSGALSAIEQLQRRSMEEGRIAAETQQARQHEEKTLGAVQTSVTKRLTAELSKLVSVMSTGSITCEVRDAGLPGNRPLRIEYANNSIMHALSGIELIIDDANDKLNRVHSLQFFFCEHARNFSTVTRRDSRKQAPSSPSDMNLAVLVLYQMTQKHLPHKSQVPGFVNRLSKVGTVRTFVDTRTRGRRVRGGGPQVRHEQVQMIGAMFDREVSLHATFKASEWPGNEDQLRAMVKDALDTFLARINSPERMPIG